MKPSFNEHFMNGLFILTIGVGIILLSPLLLPCYLIGKVCYRYGWFEDLYD